MHKRFSPFTIIRGFIYICLYQIRFYPQLLWQRLFTTEQTVHLNINNVQYDLRVHAQEGGLDEDLYLNAIREYPNVIFFHKYIKKYGSSITTFIDVGSNIGYYAVLIAETIKQLKIKNKQIICIEPVKSTFALLEKNLELNNLSHITKLNVAIGEKNGSRAMIVPREKNLSRISTIASHGIGSHPTKKQVHMITPRYLFRKHSIPMKNVFIRCDIEGFEHNLFVGNKLFFQKLTNAHIIMELHPFYLGSRKTIELLQSLKKAGFMLQQVISCEPLYFLRMPAPIRRLLQLLFIAEYNGETLGKLTRIRTISDFCETLKEPDHAVYHYPNLHLYLYKNNDVSR